MDRDEFASDLASKPFPESMSLSLMRAAALLTAWEFIRSDIVQGVKDFFCYGVDESGHYLYDDSYDSDVSSKVAKGGSPTIFDVSAEWLVGMEALTESDVELLQAIREHRNDVAHELAKYLVDPKYAVNVDLLLQARDVIQRLGQFWGQITVDTDPSFDGREVAPEDIRSGQSLLFDYVLSLVALPGPAPK